MSASSNNLIAPRFLFRFALPLKRLDPLWPVDAKKLTDGHKLPPLARLDAGSEATERSFSEVWGGWGPMGVTLVLRATGKSQPPWCRDSRIDESDGLHVWIDTRATHNIHRASKFCHRFGFLPAGGGRDATGPVADQLLINRARENARPVKPRELQVASKVTKDGYYLAAHIPESALGGFDPANYPRLGFTYAVIDRELGINTFATGLGFPFDEDPSCWATLELVD
jgi:hypothetical protein